MTYKERRQSIKAYRKSGYTLQYIATEFNLSRERIRQIILEDDNKPEYKPTKSPKFISGTEQNKKYKHDYQTTDKYREKRRLYYQKNKESIREKRKSYESYKN